MLKNLYLTDRFFGLFGALVVLFALSFVVDFLFPIAQALLVLAVVLVLLEGRFLFRRNVIIKCRRRLPKMFSLGDFNDVRLELQNENNLQLFLTIIDELPIQFQKRDFQEKLNLNPGEEKTLTYQLKPLKRGLYAFGKVNIFIATRLGLIEKRYLHDYEMQVPVYPSVLQMKQFELKAFTRFSQQKGIKKIRRIGHSYEFEQIKSYVRGDDYRSINWKASSRKAALMVNQYEDERAQQIYSIIDKSRVMRMPFEGLSLMDYAINTSLVISNIALQKHDKAGLISLARDG